MIASEAKGRRGVGRKTSRGISWRMRFLILRRDHFRCCACGRSPATHAGVNLQVDHKLAWQRGGETVEANLQTLCEQCNGGKSDLAWKAGEEAQPRKRRGAENKPKGVLSHR